MTEQFANNALSTLTAAMLSTDTTLTVANVGVFPASPQFRILVDTEIMLVTGVASNVLTVTRGAEGSIVSAHMNGATVEHILTAGALSQLKNDVVAVSAQTSVFASRPTAGTAGRIYVPTDNFLSYLDTGVAWQAYGPIYAITPPPVANDANWTWVHQGTASVAQSNDALYFTVPGGNGFQYFMRPGSGSSTASIESASFSEHTLSTTGSNAQFPFRGVAMLESSTGKGLILTHGVNTNNTAYQFYIYAANITGTAGQSQTQGATQQNNWNLDPGGLTFLRIRLSGSNIIAEYSKTRTNWTNIVTLTIASVFTTGPNQAGLVLGTGSDTLSANYNVFHMVQT